MNRRKLFVPALVAALGVGSIIGRIAVGDSPKDKPAAAAAQPEMKLPPGWTEADMQACMLAGTPGKMHELLAKDIGVWAGKNTMWMMPGGEAMKSESTSTITPLMDGRFTKCEMTGEMPGMGVYNGMGIVGFENVSQKFVGTWIDNHNTAIMYGVGELSQDGKTMTWKYEGVCPITKKPAFMRQVETVTGPNTKLMEMWGTEPKSGKEFKMMSIELTKKQ